MESSMVGGRSQQGTNHLKRIKSAAWSREAEVVGKELAYANPRFQHQKTEKQNKTK